MKINTNPTTALHLNTQSKVFGETEKVYYKNNQIPIANNVCSKS